MRVTELLSLYFDKIDQQYPGSKFILNTRQLNDWIVSRLNHIEQKVSYDHIENFISNFYKIINKYCYDPKITTKEWISIWIKMWNKHHAKVKSYFEKRSNDLLIYDIDHDSIEKINKFIEKDAKDKKNKITKINTIGMTLKKNKCGLVINFFMNTVLLIC